MTRLVKALKEVGQTFELFQKGELVPCDSTASEKVDNLVPSSYCRIPATVPGGVVPTEEKLVIRGLMGMFFDTDKTFLLPPAKGSMQRLKRLHSNNPEGKLLIVGHTDTVGLPDHNLDLSKRRAKNIEAYLKHTVEVWTAYYQPQLLSKQWGTIEDQYMLSVLPEEGPPFYTGKINGITYQQSTKDAITRFQEFINTKRLEIDDNTTDLLDVDGDAGMETRRELVRAYIERSGDPLPKEIPLFTQGCGEFHPEIPTGDGVPEARNRRTEVFFFPEKIDPPMSAGGCQAPGCVEYPQWRERSGRLIDFTKPVVRIGWTEALVNGLPEDVQFRVERTGGPVLELCLTDMVDDACSRWIELDDTDQNQEVTLRVLSGGKEFLLLDRQRIGNPDAQPRWTDFLHRLDPPEPDQPDLPNCENGVIEMTPQYQLVPLGDIFDE